LGKEGTRADKTLNPPGTATPMRPRPFLLLLAGFALALNEILADKELQELGNALQPDEALKEELGLT